MLDGAKRAISRLFGAGATPKTREASTILDELSPDNIPDGALAALWEVLDARYPETNRQIKDSIDVRAGRKRPMMHDNWDADDRENDRAVSPEMFELPRQTARKLGGKQANIKRPAAGIEPKAQKEATRIETWSNGYLDEQYPDLAVVDLLLNETQTLILQIPMPSHWECIPTLYDEMEEEGKNATQAEYDAAPPARQREYARANTNDAAPTYKRMRKRYRLDASGNADDGTDTFAVDLSRSARYFEGEMADAYARNIPIHLRGPLSRLDFIPLNPVFSGKSTDVDGVIIRTLYRKSKLKRDYRWEGCDNTELLEPVSPYDGQGGELYLYELWAYDELHRPYVAYQVGTRATDHADTSTTAVIKLWEEYPGCNELPIAFEYGQHNSGSNADLRVQTFVEPYWRNWLQRDKILTSLSISTDISGYPTWGQKITKEGVEAMRALGGDIPLEFRMQPNTVVPLIGDLVELTARGSNNDVKTLLSALQSLYEKNTVQPGALGGEGPTSGLDRQLQDRDMEIAHGDVIEGARRIKEKVGRHALMLGSAIGRKSNRPVELYVRSEAALPDGGGTTQKAESISLPPDLCGDNWDVIARFEQQPGENLANSSLFLTMLKEGAILMREFREWAVGDPHPEQFIAEKALEDYFLRNPAGQLDVLMGMAEYIRDSRLKKLLELTNKGAMTGAVGGMATSAMQDLTGEGGPPAGGGGVPGMQLPDRGAAALAGGNAGALNASAAASGGPFDPQMQGLAGGR